MEPSKMAPPIVKDDEIPFGEKKEEGAKKPDTPLQISGEDDAMHHAGKMLVYDLASVFTDANLRHSLGYSKENLDPLSNLFVYGFFASKEQCLYVKIERERLQQCLEEIYGPELKDSGIYDQVAFPQQGPVDLGMIQEYFPDCAILNNLNNTYLSYTGTPYRMLLRLCVQDRPFFARIMREKGWNNEHVYAWDRLRTAFSLQDLLEQGKKDQCIPEVGRLWKLYKDIEW